MAKPKSKKTVTLYVASVTKWDEGVLLRAFECTEHALVVEAPDAVGAMGWQKNFKKAALPLTRISGAICGACALTEKEARAALLEGLLLRQGAVESELDMLRSMVSYLKNGVDQTPAQRSTRSAVLELDPPHQEGSST